jgi:hypothetical protein
MKSEFNHIPVEEEIKVYRNDFYAGFALLVKKLFML